MPLTALQKDILIVLAASSRTRRGDGSVAGRSEPAPDLPIGVAFVDASGKPGWIGNDPALRLHGPSVRGYWPTVHGLEP